MLVKFNAIVRDVFPSTKSEIDYVLFMDKDTGGDVKLSYDRGVHKLVQGQELAIEVNVKGRMFSNSVDLRVVSDKPQVKRA